MSTDFEDQDLDDSWDCPTCMRPMEKEDDHECSTCGMNASEHISVTSLCRILKDVSGREAALIVERDKLKRMLELQITISGEAVIELESRTAQRDAERALADRLAVLVQRHRDGYGGQSVDADCDCSGCEYLRPIDAALAAWKEARSE